MEAQVLERDTERLQEALDSLPFLEPVVKDTLKEPAGDPAGDRKSVV